MSVINTNVKSLVAQQSLGVNERNMKTTMERLSTGNRINSAKDDAAGLAISNRMDSQVRGLNMAIRNANDGISLLQTAEGAMQEVTNMLQRMRELSVQSVNAVNNGSDRSALDAEVQQLKTEIDRVAKTTQFNGINLLDGSFGDKTLQIGDRQGQTLGVSIGSVETSQLGMDASRFGGDVLVGARIGTLVDLNEGDIRINGQDLKEFVAADEGDLGGLVANINRSVDNVVASAFNTVVAQEKGDGKVAATELTITVQPLRTEKGVAPATVAFEIGASESMDELVANINAQTAGLVEASVNDDGKLVLANDTGATITVEDGSATAATYDGGSGFGATSKDYAGFLKLESTDGSAVRVERGNIYDFDAAGNQDNLNLLGFNTVAGITDGDAYTVTGRQLSAAGAAQEWNKDDLVVNGVVIYDKDIDTDSFEGKLEAINNFSEETGVTASAYFEQSFDLDPTAIFENTAFTATDKIWLNGNDVAVGADIDALVTNINAATTQHGLVAEAKGNTLILKGDNIQAVTIAYSDTADDFTAAAVDLLNQAAATEYGRIRLDSKDNTPISIQLGEGVESSPGAVDEAHGFLQNNVGAADYDKNAPALGVGGSGSSLSGLNIASEASASKAIGVIDNGIQRVDDIRAELGAVSNRLESTINNLTNVVTNTSAAQSRIRDTDYAVETTNLARAQIIQQAATAMLAQANQQPSSVLALLQ